MSPELELLDQLLGDDLSLPVVRRIFPDDNFFARAMNAMLETGEVRLIGNDGVELPRWQWQQILRAREHAAEIRVQITTAGASRIG